jgi:hypothetical protein
MSTKQRIFIPTYISSVDYQPARVQPRLFFYNGLKDCEPYYVASGSRTLATNEALEAFPYFDNYSGANTTTSSLSLLFFNEEAPYGVPPTASLYTQYWEDYVELLYNPRTRLLNASAIIPLADYFKMELNDIVEFRGNNYHLRAINDYSLTNGECKIQLLGPILRESSAATSPVETDCSFTFSSSISPVTTTSTSTTSTTTAPLLKYRAEFYLCSGQSCVLQSFTVIQGSSLVLNKYYRVENGNIFRPIEASTASLALTIIPVSVSDTCNPLCGAPTTTTTSTTTIAGCSTYTVSNGAGNGSVRYTPCGSSVSQLFFLPANSQYNICVANNQISINSGTNVSFTNLGTVCTQTPTTCAQFSVFNPTGTNQTFSYVACNDTQCNASLVAVLTPGETRVVCVKPQSLVAGNNTATSVGSCSSSCFLPINIAPTTTSTTSTSTTSTSTTSTSTTSTTTLPPTTTTTTTVNCNFDFSAASTTAISATGGRMGTFVSGGITYQYHDFETVGTNSLNILSGFTNQAQILVVAGGGPGGQSAGGGGGGIIYRNNITLVQNNYSVVVGAGGLPFSLGPGGTTVGSSQGGNSQFTPTWVAQGGGYGGYSGYLATPNGNGNGGNGGSGGGAGFNRNGLAGVAGQGTLGQGFAGGAARNTSAGNDGGGGGSFASTGSSFTFIGGKGAFFELGALVKASTEGFQNYVTNSDFAGGGGSVAIAWNGSTSISVTSGGSKGSRTGLGRPGRDGHGGGGSTGTTIIDGDIRGFKGGSGRVIVVYPYIAPAQPLTIQYLAVAGGGAGGFINRNVYNSPPYPGQTQSRLTGGGGAGGFRSGSILMAGDGSVSLPITVGLGGVNTNISASAGVNGGNSSISNLISVGGGGGSAQFTYSVPIQGGTQFITPFGEDAKSGGSGGGAIGRGTGQIFLTNGAGIAGQGFAGNANGGGASGTPPSSTAGPTSVTGPGRTSVISGASVTYSQGGRGDSFGVTNGIGFGGNGWDAAQSDTRGNNGIVILRYPGAQRATGGTITQSGGDTIHTFTSNGVFTPYTP